MGSPKLPVLLLPHPLILLPTARVTLPISRSLADAILSLLDDSDAVLAAIPLPAPDSPSEVTYGTAARIARLVRPRNQSSPTQPYLLSLHGIQRIRFPTPIQIDRSETLPVHNVVYPSSEGIPSRDTVEAFKHAALLLLDRLAKDSPQPQRKDDWLRVAAIVEDISEQRATWMADVLVAAVSSQYPDKLAFLAATDVEDRLRRATELFVKQSSIQEVSKKIASAVDESFSRQQKEYFLRQQLAAIQRELQSLQSSPASVGTGFGTGGATSELDDDDQADADDLADLRRKIEALDVGSEERKVGIREWRRLKRIPQGSVENGVIRSYLEWLTSVPWPSNKTTTPLDVLKDHSFLTRARAQLDADHYGLDQIKRRLMEYLAVVRLRAIADAAQTQAQGNNPSTDTFPGATPTPPTKSKGVKGPILLFVGPPGTGKTSLGQSIAKALGRPFQRISLGGVRDEAEIRGHRRTYVASGPGSIVQALRKAGRNDPVILLDEVDKVGHSNFHGDPAAALLEVLDPEQNHSFNDHYINVPIDLSQVLFICTSNTIDTISAPLLDRCEVVELSGYTYDEKMHIAKRFLLPKQICANGLSDSQLTLTDDALLHVATMYTREAGVRSLERAIGAVVRFKAVEWAEWLDKGNGTMGGEGNAKQNENGNEKQDANANENGVRKEWRATVEPHELEKILGIPRWDGEERDREEKRGVVYGLVVTGMGEGGILPVESTALPGTGRLKLTGSLGDVIKESGEIALSWVKTHAFELGITAGRGVDPLKVPDVIDVHLHLPAGAQKKDGPSAGIAMICAFVSLLSGACVPKDIAMTGEITLRGRVTPVGGIRMKVLGAHRAQIRKVILPWANRKDVEHDVALEVRREMQFFFVRTIDEALEAAFGRGALGWRKETVLLESRL
ncbi:Lon protease C-terminal proteolytic domain-containing protein [Suillus subalutaceus]|uniref:Lon protease C-terminal proteolytic domain-containing protein n=1 Tax=Suillus subalutaceus TaxID=48586 RepID=UPI001B87AE8D|nr:Lon protease C-terminal proteolytic domain-containing protein [Suillus subalutaceus]KAG1834990.1 Lon protease C-terminal proteolytic domain-containing protein [Suillus subalutaceus]